MTKLELHQQRSMITVAYIVAVIGTGAIFIIAGFNFNDFLVDAGATLVVFGIVLAKPIVRFLHQRGIKEFQCSGCGNWFQLVGRWRCKCQAVSIRHAFTRCQRPE